MARRKRLVFCFDGTWNRLSADCPTNVVMLAQMVKPVAHDGTPQIVYYDEGIGTQTNWINQRYQGITGKGLMLNLREAYRFLIFNYEPGDEIFAFGFSRGAFTARSFIGFIRHAGILDVASATKIDKAMQIYRKAPAGQTGEETGLGLRFRARYCRGVCVSEADREFRSRVDPAFDPDKVPLLDIRYVGVWDTVSALGLPEFVPGAKWINRKYGFHDAVLTSKIKAARHAVALDELRPTFRATLFGRAKVAELNARAEAEAGKPLEEWELPYMEKWFPGVHGAVGGGGSRRGLSDGALAWVLRGATIAGLDLRRDDDGVAYRLRSDALDYIENEAAKSIWKRGPIGWLRRLAHSPRTGPEEAGEIALATYQRWFAPPAALPDEKPYRPGALASIAAVMDGWPFAALPQYKAATKRHIVLRGETLFRIAEAELGDGHRHPEIFEANRDLLEDPDALPIGLSLRIP